MSAAISATISGVRSMLVIRPFGPTGDIYLYESSGVFNQNLPDESPLILIFATAEPFTS